LHRHLRFLKTRPEWLHVPLKFLKAPLHATQCSAG
jgi:hypothetical protein